MFVVDVDFAVQSAPAGGARAASARLGGLLYEEITAALAGFDGTTWSRLPNAGVLRVLHPGVGDAYGMIHGPSVPAVLVEYGYLSNAAEAALFATGEYIRAAAVATADAVEAYLHTDRLGSGFIDTPASTTRRRHPGPAWKSPSSRPTPPATRPVITTAGVNTRVPSDSSRTR